jgi:hypothetical protein
MKKFAFFITQVKTFLMTAMLQLRSSFFSFFEQTNDVTLHSVVYLGQSFKKNTFLVSPIWQPVFSYFSTMNQNWA